MFRLIGQAFSLEGFFGLLLGRFVSGALYLGFYLALLFGVVVLGEFLVGGGRIAETWARRAERLSCALRRPGHVGGAVARPP